MNLGQKNSMIPKTLFIKEKNNKMDFSKFETFKLLKTALNK